MKITLTLLAFFLAFPALACTTFSIDEPTLSLDARVKSQFIRATSVIRARVTEVKDVRRPDPNNPAKRRNVVAAQIVVAEVFKGPVPRTVLTYLPIPHCSLILLPGHEYVFSVDGEGMVFDDASFELFDSSNGVTGRQLLAIRALMPQASK
jgi:hypothetical protein